METRSIEPLFCAAHDKLEDLRDHHYGDALDDDAKIVAATAALIIEYLEDEIINPKKEDK